MRSALAAAGTPPRLVIDLSDVSVLHPVVLGVLLDARRSCRRRDGAMALVVTTSEVAVTLATTDVEALFEVTPGLPQAMAQVSRC